MRRSDRRKSPILIGRKSEKFIQSDRYSILHKEGVNDLTIYNVTQEDAGEYICQINTEPMKNYVSSIVGLGIFHTQTDTRTPELSKSPVQALHCDALPPTHKDLSIAQHCSANTSSMLNIPTNLQP